MSLLRLIARLDIKGQNVVKGIHLEGLRVVGKPEEMARRYAEEGADELLYMDCVASLYGRNQLEGLLERTTEKVFIPVTVGGGIRSRGDVQRLLGAGADKVAINTAAIKNPSLIKECAEYFGSQAVVVSIESKRSDAEMGGWEALSDSGRERTGKNVLGWAEEAVSLGAGEILITSVDKEGTQRGCDLELIRALSHLPVPVSYCGGVGSVSHAVSCIAAGADALAIASALHYRKVGFEELRKAL
jgi:cyclase